MRNRKRGFQGRNGVWKSELDVDGRYDLLPGLLLGLCSDSIDPDAEEVVLTICHGDIRITPPSMAKFGELFLNRGIWRGRRIVPEEWVDDSVFPWISFADLGFALQQGDGHGYLWWIEDHKVGERTLSVFNALGWGSQQVWVVPESNLVVVSSHPSFSQSKLFESRNEHLSTGHSYDCSLWNPVDIRLW